MPASVPGGGAGIGTAGFNIHRRLEDDVEVTTNSPKRIPNRVLPGLRAGTCQGQSVVLLRPIRYPAGRCRRIFRICRTLEPEAHCRLVRRMKSTVQHPEILRFTFVSQTFVLQILHSGRQAVPAVPVRPVASPASGIPLRLNLFTTMFIDDLMPFDRPELDDDFPPFNEIDRMEDLYDPYEYEPYEYEDDEYLGDDLFGDDYLEEEGYLGDGLDDEEYVYDDPDDL